MGELIRNEDESKIQIVNGMEIIEVSEALLTDVRKKINNEKNLSIPIAELSTLGAGISSLVPEFNTVAQTAVFSTSGLYRVANASTGDVLKIAKNGNAWGSLKTSTGKSKMAQFAEVDPVSVTTHSVAAFNPSTMLMAAALYSIEKQMSEIAETQKQIMTFLEIKDESDVEGDMETLNELIKNYKFNWDNDRYVTSSHKMVMDIKRKARSSMLSYQKRVTEVISLKKIMVAQDQVKSEFIDIEKKLKYYRLNLYTYSLATMMEIMLGGNYKEDYISSNKEEIKKMSEDYRKLFEKSSKYIEELSTSSVETNVLKGIGAFGKAVGDFIGSIPLVKEGPVDEFLIDNGTQLEKNAKNMEMKVVHQLAAVENPGTSIFIDKMEDMIQIYNHTEQIYIDDEKLYLVIE